MNEVKKNWKKTWEDYEPTEYDKIYRSARRPQRGSHRPPSFIIIILVFIVGIGGAYMWEMMNSKLTGEEADEPMSSFMDNMVVSNRNGMVMNNSLDTIYGIFDDVSEHVDDISKQKMATYKEQIQNVDLSEEYAEFKQQCINKLTKAEEYSVQCEKWQKEKSEEKQEKIEKEADKILDEYNAIDIEEYLAKAFDKVGIEHSFDKSGKIHYEYFE